MLIRWRDHFASSPAILLPWQVTDHSNKSLSGLWFHLVCLFNTGFVYGSSWTCELKCAYSFSHVVCSVLIAVGVLILGAIDSHLAALGAVFQLELKNSDEQETVHSITTRSRRNRQLSDGAIKDNVADWGEISEGDIWNQEFLCWMFSSWCALL